MRPVVVTGPTASGKSALGERLARELRGEIVNADSVQVYKGLDIGSAKSTKELCKEIPHHLLSIIEPCTPFDAGSYQQHADAAIADISGRGKVPIVVGGSGLYIRALLNGLAKVPEVPTGIREQVQERVAEIRTKYSSDYEALVKIHAWLAELDEPASKRLSVRDSQRVVRAIEVALSGEKTLSDHHTIHAGGLPRYEAFVVCLLPPKELLYPRLDERVDKMFADGLEWEVKNLRENYPNFVDWCDVIGYRHVNEFLDNRVPRETSIELMKRDTRRFAKRQYTWWRHEPERMGWHRVGDEKIKKCKGELEVDDVGFDQQEFAVASTLSNTNRIAAWAESYRARGAISELIGEFLYGPKLDVTPRISFLAQ